MIQLHKFAVDCNHIVTCMFNEILAVHFKKFSSAEKSAVNMSAEKIWLAEN